MVNYRSNIDEEPRKIFGQQTKSFVKKYWPYISTAAVLAGVGAFLVYNHRSGRYEKVFGTEKGSLYLYNPKKNTWRREKFDGTVHDSMAYIGSIDPQANRGVFPKKVFGIDLDSEDEFWRETYNQLALIRQIKEGTIPGFKPYFIKGYVPVGIEHDLEPTLTKDQGTIKTNKPWPYSFSVNVGHEIKWVNPKYEASNPQFRK
jgi:hypothetical protein